MKSLLAAELLKLRTTRTFVALVGAAGGLSLIVVTLSALLTKTITLQDARLLFTIDFTGIFILLLGVIGMAGEWRHRTITGTVLAAPNRLRLMTAKVLAYAAAGALLSLIVTVTIMLVGSIVLSARGFDVPPLSDLFDVLWRNLLVAALLGSLGVGIGALLRNQIFAIVAVLIFAFALEPALYGLVPEVGRWGPTAGAPAGIIEVTPFGEPDVDDVLLSTGLAVIVMFGWIGLFFTAAAVRLKRRDLV